ncbi:MAG: hypothetical protein OHK0029_34550 [Armatimonadaceae bacterium]
MTRKMWQVWTGILVWGLLLCCPNGVQAQEPIMLRGSGKVVTDTRSVGDFSAVDASGVGSVLIAQGDRDSLTIEADDNVLPYISTEVKNGVLHLGFNERLSLRDVTIRYRLTVRKLDQVSLPVR